MGTQFIPALPGRPSPDEERLHGPLNLLNQNPAIGSASSDAGQWQVIANREGDSGGRAQLPEHHAA